MAINTRTTVMAIGTGMQLIAGISESIADIKDLFVNPDSDMAIEIGTMSLKDMDSVVVVNGNEDFLMSFYQWRLEEHNFNRDIPYLEYIEPKELSELFGTTGKYALIAFSKDFDELKGDYDKFCEEYYLEQDIDEREPEESEKEEEKVEEPASSDEEVVFRTDETFFDDSENKTKKKVKEPRPHHIMSEPVTAFQHTLKREATERDYRKDSEHSEEKHTEINQSEAERAEKAREYVREQKDKYIPDHRLAQTNEIIRDTDLKLEPLSSNALKPAIINPLGEPENHESFQARENVRKERLAKRSENGFYTAIQDIRNVKEDSGNTYQIHSPSFSKRTDTNSKSEPDQPRNSFTAENSEEKVTRGRSGIELIPIVRSSEEIYANGNTIGSTVKQSGEKAVYTQQRYYSAISVVNNSQLQKGIRSSSFIMRQVLIPSDTTGGKPANTAINIAVPIGEYAIMHHLRENAIELGKRTSFNQDIFFEALMNGTPLKEDQVTNELMTMLQALRSQSNDGVVSMHDVNQYLIQNDKAGLITIVLKMNPQQYRGFLNNLDISDDFRKAMLSVNGKFLINKDTFEKLANAAMTDTDRELVQMLKSSLLEGKYTRATFLSIIKSSVRRYSRQMMGRSEGTIGVNTTSSLVRVIESTYKVGLKLITNIARTSGASSKTIERLVFAKNPVKNIINHTFKILHGGVRTGFTTGTTAGATATTAGVASAAGTGVAAGTVTGTVAGTVVPETIAGVGASSASAAAGAGVTSSGATAGTAATGGGVAAGGVAVGWIIAIILAILIIIIAIISAIRQSKIEEKQENYSDPSVGGYMYVQDTEILDEVANMLTQKNTAFMTEINTTASNRSGNAYNPQFDEGVDLTFYENGGYAVIFKDFEGNVLEPNTVDLNNTKAILAMATKYIPYPFTKLSDNASTEQKNEYEQIKQYFIDYCSYLWVCTHQITIEEYHPGDVKYAEYDNTGMVTDSEGQCDQNGTTIWLPDNFVPNEVDECICDLCSSKPNTGMGDYGDALCTHGKSKNEHDGWRLTGNKQTHYNCPEGHYVCVSQSWESGYTDDEGHYHSGHWNRDYGTVHCGDRKNASVGGGIWLCNERHKHICYEWIYDCGSHMGSVVYVTIGDLSRIPSLPAAGDVDYSQVGNYPGSN